MNKPKLERQKSRGRKPALSEGYEEQFIKSSKNDWTESVQKHFDAHLDLIESQKPKMFAVVFCPDVEAVAKELGRFLE